MAKHIVHSHLCNWTEYTHDMNPLVTHKSCWKMGKFGFMILGVVLAGVSWAPTRFPLHSRFSVKLYIFLFMPTYILIHHSYRISTSSAVSGRILGITCQDPEYPKSNRLHFDNRFRFFFIDLRHILTNVIKQMLKTLNYNTTNSNFENWNDNLHVCNC